MFSSMLNGHVFTDADGRRWVRVGDVRRDFVLACREDDPSPAPVYLVRDPALTKLFDESDARKKAAEEAEAVARPGVTCPACGVVSHPHPEATCLGCPCGRVLVKRKGEWSVFLSGATIPRESDEEASPSADPPIALKSCPLCHNTELAWRPLVGIAGAWYCLTCKTSIDAWGLTQGWSY